MPDCEAIEDLLMLVLSVEDPVTVDEESDEMLAAPDVEDAPLMSLLAEPEDAVEEDWIASREVAIAKTISL